MKKNNVLVIGAGRIAKDYVAVLLHLGKNPVVVGRSVVGAKRFQDETGVPAISGGIKEWVRNAPLIPSHAIIAVDANQLARVTQDVLTAGCRNILVEKPGALTRSDLRTVALLAKRMRARVFIAYNRRVLSSVIEARRCIEKEGGPTSFYFEFNERVNQKNSIAQLGIPKSVQTKWFIANTTHVIDLAFYICGKPLLLQGFAVAGPKWSPHPTLYSGAGITHKNVPFAYYANWEVAGPWKIEIGTKFRKYILNPLESLCIEESSGRNHIISSSKADTQFRAGFLLQTREFLTKVHSLPTIDEQLEVFRWYEAIQQH